MTQTQKRKYPFGTEYLDSEARGLEYLGGGVLSVANINIPTTGSIIVPVRDQYFIVGRITSFVVAETVSMQVGSAGVIDTTTKYRHRNLIGPGGNALGITTYYNTSTATTTQWNLAYNSSAITHNDVGATNAVVFFVLIGNALGASKTASWSQARGTAAAGTAGKLFTGGGEYVNTTNSNAQLNCFKLKTSLGEATMGIDSGFGIWGRDY